MKFVLAFWIFFFSITAFGQTKYEKDFDEFWNDVKNNYAYFDQQQLDWGKVKEIYLPQVKKIGNRNDFILFLETVINEIYNGHISLNTNLASSNNIIPSGQDLFVEKIKDRFYITDIRKGYGADLAGLKLGNEIVLFNGKPVDEQVGLFLPKAVTVHTPEMYQYALNMLFAGTHDVKRQITIKENGALKAFYPDSLQRKITTELIETKRLNPATGYIKINNSLGNLEMIDAFDKAVDSFFSCKNLVIDLTETPGGGNTTVARSIMGRFISRSMPYQQHEFDERRFQTKRKWIEYVTPRKAQYKGKLFVIVGHWTGSMGEGIAIGFDGLKRATITGTRMAGLLGAINGFTMTETNIGFQIPTERLYHINGTPREKYIPERLTKNIDETLRTMKEIK